MTFPVNEISYTAFTGAVRNAALSARRPLSAAVELTHRCPLACRHCYNNLPQNDPASRQELSVAEHHRFVDELVAAGSLWMLYTGGEIFARKDFFPIYEYAHDRGMLVTLFTNGVLVNESVVQRLSARRPFSIEVTLYGASNATYERMTGLRDGFDRCLRALEALKAAGLPLKLKTVPTTHNLEDLPRMREVADRLGVAFKFDALVNPRTDCSSSPLRVRLTADEIVALDLQDTRRVDAWRALHLSHGVPSAQADLQYHCGAGITSFALDPYGRISMCVLSAREFYDWRSGSLSEAWNGFLRQVRARPITRPTKCNHCALKSMCGMCPANAEMHSGGDPEEPVEFLCEVAHLRAATLGLEVPAHGACAHCAPDARQALEARGQKLAAPREPSPRPRSLPLVAEGAGACGSGCGCG
ncbi:MAG: radical SAM protein [Myxococcales bacterium]|nr:radical SAM protein [Myxococcales bacterium]